MNTGPISKLVVFDLDGTLIDSRHDLAESANQMLASYGAPPLSVDAVAGMVGDGASVLVRRVLEASGLGTDRAEALERFLAIYDRQLLVKTRPYDGVVEALAAASRRVPLAVLTNKPSAPTERLLEAFGFASSVRWTLGGDSGFPRKPDPAGLLSLVASAGARPETTLLVGDSMVDVETGRRAGTRVCVARYGFGNLRSPVTLREGELEVADPAGLRELLSAFLDEMNAT